MTGLLTQLETIGAIRAGLAEGHCVLCRADVQTFMDELVCPHWFITSGRAAFRLQRLIRVFQMYDLENVLQYLRIVAESQQEDPFDEPYVERLSADCREVIIRWRKRRWTFLQAACPDGGYATQEFQVSTYYCGDIVEKGRITLGPALGKVRLALLLRAPSTAQRDDAARLARDDAMPCLCDQGDR